MEHSDVDGLLDAPCYSVLFPIKDLYTLHGDLVVWPPIKVPDRVHYMAKCQKCLDDKKTYEKLKRDSTKKYKTQLSAMPLELKENRFIDYKT